VADYAVEIAGRRLAECSAPQAAIVAGIFAQRSSELLEQTPGNFPFTVNLLLTAEQINARLQNDIKEIKRVLNEPAPNPDEQ